MRKFTLIVAALAGSAQAQLFEGFDPPAGFPTPPGLPSGWTSVNTSFPPGPNPDWNWRTDSSVFGPHSGTGYAFANYQAVSVFGDIRLYLISPVVTLHNGDALSFWTRTSEGSIYPDRLRLIYNTTGTFTPADFTHTLLTINPSVLTGIYPETWTRFEATFTGLSGPTSGRFAFLYDVPGGGSSGANSNYVGVDDVLLVPAPSSILVLLGMWPRRRRIAAHIQA